MIDEENFGADSFNIHQPDNSWIKKFSPALDVGEFPLIKTGASLLEQMKESPLIDLGNSVFDHAQKLSAVGLAGLTIQDVKPWLITEEPVITVKPTIEEELSKIHEELACMNKTVNEIRHESIQKDEIIEQQQKENKKLKAQLKKEKTKNKSNNNQIQYEVDDLQSRMNEVEWRVDIKEKGK